MSALRRQATSQDHDGGMTRARIRRRLGLVGAAAVARLPKRPAHGVGGLAHLHYCECGAKKAKGACPRCS